MKIFIDPGHGGTDSGAVGQNGTYESNVVLEVAMNLKKLLENNGHVAKCSRERDESVGLSERADMANAWGADLFVSVHANSASDVAAHGTETYCYPGAAAAKERAVSVQRSLVAYLGRADRGVKTANFAVLRETAMPAILVELAFLSNPTEEALLADAAFRQRCAAAIAAGIAGEAAEPAEDGPQTAMRLDGVWVQQMEPAGFDLRVCDVKKREVGEVNYFNAGFFTDDGAGHTIPVGNLACGGEVVAQAKDNPGWINVANHDLSTIVVRYDGSVALVKTRELGQIAGLKCAVSGIPIIANGKYVPREAICAEGYFGNELYDTWHGFLGIRDGKLVYAAAKCAFADMCWILVALGVYNAIKLDGGGSFILRNGKELAGTSENRQIHNVGIWKG